MALGDSVDMSPLSEAAVQLHEMYEEFKKAGFSEEESMKLTSQIVLSFFNS